MPFAITTYFDTDSELRIKAIWKELADKNLSKYMHESGNRPHIKLVVYDEIDLDGCREKLSKYIQTAKAFTITFKYFAIFPLNNNVFAGPAKNIELYNLQKDIRLLLSEVTVLAENRFAEQCNPDQWVPDCILARAIEIDMFPEIFKVINCLNLPFQAKVSVIGIFEFFPVKHIGTFKLSC